MCLALSYLCLMMFMDPDKYTSYVFRNSIFIKLVSLFGLILCVAGFIALFVKSLKNNIGIVLNDEGIIDNSNAISIGLIRWDDIINIRTTKFMRYSYIVIEVRDNDYYIKKIKNKFKLRLMKSNIKMYGTPITINSSILKCDFDNLQNIIIQRFNYWKKYGSLQPENKKLRD